MYRIFGHYIPRGQLFTYILEITILFISIFLAILISFGLFYNNSDGQILGNSVNTYEYLYACSIIYTIIMHLVMISAGLYQRDLPVDAKTLIVRMHVSVIIGAVILNFLNIWLQLDLLSLHVQVLAYTFTMIGILSTRLLLSRETNTTTGHHRILVVGTGQRASNFHHSSLLAKRNTGLLSRTGINIIGYVDAPGSKGHTLLHESKIIKLNNLSLCQFAVENSVNEIIIAMDERRNVLPIDDLIDCRLNGIKITDENIFQERESGCIVLENFQPNSLIFSTGFSRSFRYKAKRILDITAALLIITISSPVMLITALVVWLESGCKGTVIYRQERVGLGGKSFNLLKFRSMVDNAEKNGAVWAMVNDTRVTRIGRFLRKSRIDELPQLLNVLKGEMSLVGPRPERPQFVEELAKEIPYFKLRHHVLPGITGWAQTCFPYGATVEDAKQKLQYDLYYIKNYSIFLDVLIMFQTTAVIIWAKGAR